MGAITSWMLIYWIATGGGTHLATGTGEFSEQGACKSALAMMQKAKAPAQGLWGICVPQGGQQ